MGLLLLWLWQVFVAPPRAVAPLCPPKMVRVSPTACIDVLPFPNDDEGEVWLGLSAIEEGYLDLGQMTWDAETLCAEAGKRLCTAEEWTAACRGTPRQGCPTLAQYVDPDWRKVMTRDGDEMLRLDQHSDWLEYPDCVSTAGARMMGDTEEWVRVGEGYAFSRGFWAREGRCDVFVASHAPNWHDYATTTRCCLDL